MECNFKLNFHLEYKPIDILFVSFFIDSCSFLIIINFFYIFQCLFQAKPLETDDVKKILMKAYEIYKQMDGMTEEESYNFIDSFRKIPMADVWIETEPDDDLVRIVKII